MESIVIVVVALVVGVWAGASFARTNRARADLRGTKKLVGGLRTKLWNSVFHSLRAVLLIAGTVFMVYLGLRAAGKL